MARNKFNIELTSISKSINYKFGLSAENNNKVIYFYGKGWVAPLKNDYNYAFEVDKIRRRFDRLVRKYFANGKIFSSDYIGDFDIPTDKFIVGKKKFMQFECYLLQTGNKDFNEIKPIMDKKLKEINDELSSFINERAFSLI